ncbi:MAG: PEP-CTERM sorting domain-containing protein [Planctomycetota bacterium]
MTIRSRFALRVGLVALALTLAAPGASAQLVLDQENDAFAAPSPSGELGGPAIDSFQTPLQTFTVGVGGLLAEVEVQAQKSDAPSTPDGDLVLTILGTTGGVPDFAQDMGSANLPAASIPDFSSFASAPFAVFDVTGLGINVAPGDVLAIALSYPVGAGSYFIFDSEVDSYAGGTSFVSNLALNSFFTTSPRDLGFRTRVLVPEPASAALLGLGSLLVARRRR